MLERLRSAVPDALVAVGLLLVSAGSWAIYAPAGPIVLGLGLIAAVRYGYEPTKTGGR